MIILPEKFQVLKIQISYGHQKQVFPTPHHDILCKDHHLTVPRGTFAAYSYFSYLYYIINDMNILKIFVLLSLIFFYLLFSYIRFYHFIGDIDLKSPYLENFLLLENQTKEGSAKYVALGDSLSAGVGST